ncbi:MAG: hypothetical protein K8S25_08105 [Alphaproteobacteria bacterium]|nr:hypothetical protein [Alphaproteobacteria bacterium]
MGRAQLKALMASGSSIVFDARARTIASDVSGMAPNGQNASMQLPSFFAHGLLKNALLFKSVERGCSSDPDGVVSHTRLFIPFDSERAGNGGKSLVFGPSVSAEKLGKFFGVENIEPARIKGDLDKLALLAKAPSFSAFLLRDAFERAGIETDKRFFQISDTEADALRENLKAKLKPLAAMALNLSATVVGNAQLDLLARKLWELDDPAFLMPLARALKIPEADTTSVFYAWIGAAYFQREFAKRQAKVRLLAEWLAAKSPFPAAEKEEIARQYEDDRCQVRERLRWAWSTAAKIFERYTVSYDALIAGRAGPFVEYLQTVQTDFTALGTRLSVIEYCLSFYDLTASLDRNSIASIELLREVARTMRNASGESESGRAAA